MTYSRMRSGIRKGPGENTQEFRKTIPIGGWGLTCKYTTQTCPGAMRTERHCEAKRLLPQGFPQCPTNILKCTEYTGKNMPAKENGRAA